MKTIWDTGTLKMQTNMLGHRDTKNADRLGHSDTANADKKMGERRRKKEEK